MSAVDKLAVALFEAYARNGGNPPAYHYDRAAGEQWMALALEECGVVELINAARGVTDNFILADTTHGREIHAALVKLGCG